LVVFIHGSLVRKKRDGDEDWMETGDVGDLISLIRMTNVEARVVVYGANLELPTIREVREFRADGFVLVPSENEVWEHFARKGKVSKEEIEERGKTIEVYSRGRYNPEGLMMRYGRVERDMTSE
jgi:hypothetical protein